MVKDDSQQIIDNHRPIPPGYELLKHVEPQTRQAAADREVVVVKKRPENGLAGDIVKSAHGGARQLGRAAD